MINPSVRGRFSQSSSPFCPALINPHVAAVRPGTRSEFLIVDGARQGSRTQIAAASVPLWGRTDVTQRHQVRGARRIPGGQDVILLVALPQLGFVTVKAHLAIVTHQLKFGDRSRAVYFAQSFSSPWYSSLAILSPFIVALI